MSNVVIWGLLFLFVSLFTSARYLTSKDHFLEYTNKTGRSLQKDFPIMLTFVLSTIVGAKFLFDTTSYSEYEQSLYLMLFSIVMIQLGDSYLTDTEIHRININSSRLSYIFSIAISILTINEVYHGQSKVLPYVVLTGLLILSIIILLFVHSLGAADARNMMIIFPPLVALYGKMALFMVFFTFIFVIVYQVFKQKINKSDGPVPIGDKLLMPTAVSIPIVVIWELIRPLAFF